MLTHTGVQGRRTNGPQKGQLPDACDRQTPLDYPSRNQLAAVDKSMLVLSLQRPAVTATDSASYSVALAAVCMRKAAEASLTILHWNAPTALPK